MTPFLTIIVLVVGFAVGLTVGYTLGWGRAHKKAWTTIDETCKATMAQLPTNDELGRKITAFMLAQVSFDFVRRMKP